MVRGYGQTLAVSDLPISTPTATPTPTFTPTATAAASAHVGDLDGSISVPKKGWRGKVTILVHDQSHKPVANAVVLGTWNNTNPAPVQKCSTGGKGTCSITSDSLPTSLTAVTFSVTGISHATLVYHAGANHDVDGGTNGTTITMSRR
jgi:hypothetical protein